MSMTSSGSRAGLRVLGGAGLVGGYIAFGVPAAVSSTWGSFEQAASSAASRGEMTFLAAWIGLGLLALVLGMVSLALLARRRRLARGVGQADQAPREQASPVARPAAAVSASHFPAHA
ncbi:hypothetical protein [Demequina sp. NBRC 110054]|uniref:hypothetical protein n=1 Tax=Demequina sp. NBRC 110054 TaxID=1570343 RepID=UPI0009FBF96B|nr:hypothetical protein [Demequina sp. NBRC 110054]